MNRQPAIDLTRGFIMILMALDHANIFLGTIHWNEPWGLNFSYYSQIGQWFTRFVTHLCAPGFFFLMGMSMVLFTTSRQQKNWTSFQIIKYFLKRGGLIMLCMLLLEFPAWGIGLMANSGIPFFCLGKPLCFFFIAHLFVFALASLIISKGVSLPILYSIWLVGLVPLYFLCRWFLNFKRQKAANSI